MVALVARGQIDTTTSRNGRKVEVVADAAGNLHVPPPIERTDVSLTVRCL
jgi:hypothetical protein